MLFKKSFAQRVGKSINGHANHPLATGVMKAGLTVFAATCLVEGAGVVVSGVRKAVRIVGAKFTARKEETAQRSAA
jgi:hypothetical protein